MCPQIIKTLFIVLLFLCLQQNSVEPKSLSIAQTFENGFVKILDSGRKYCFSCQEGFQLVGESEIYYENNKWSNKIPICVPIIRQIDFPMGRYVVSEEGRKYTFSCNKGFHLEGKKELNFENDQWDGSIPRCVYTDHHHDNNDEFTSEISKPKKTYPHFQIVMKGNGSNNNYNNGCKNTDDKCDDDNDNDCDNNNDKCDDDDDNNGCDNNDDKCYDKKNDCNNNNDKCDDNDDDDDDDDDDDNDDDKDCDNDDECDDNDTDDCDKNDGCDDTDKDDHDFKNDDSHKTVGRNHLKIQLVRKDRNCLDVQEITLTNGFVRKLRNKCKYIFQCNEGFTLLGDKQIEYQNFEWIGTKPICVATHDLEIEHGKFEIKVDAGICSLQYKCAQGFQMKGSSEIVINNNGQIFLIKRPTCLALCPVTPIYFGRIQINELTHAVNFTCDDGYQLEGHFESVCENGQWSLPFPVCKQTCPKIHLLNGGITMHGNTAMFHCNQNYDLVGNESSICQEGQWTNEIPICTPKCSSIQLTQAHKIMSFDWKFTYYNFSCKEGYTLKGNNEIFCRFGQWNHPVPICEPTNRPYQATDGFTLIR